MSLFNIFKVRATAPVARERVALGPRDLLAILRENLIATIARHIEIDPEKVTVKMDPDGAVSALEIDVEIPSQKIVGDGKRRANAVEAA